MDNHSWIALAMQFAAADISGQSPPAHSTRPWRRPTIGPDRIEFHNVTLWYTISYAYEIKSYQCVHA